MKRDLIRLSDLGDGGITAMLDRSAFFARVRGKAEHPRPLAGHAVALLFDKPSTRTRLSLEVATYELGGHPIIVTPDSTQMSRGEPTEDTARVLGRMVSAVTYRTSTTARFEAMARACRAPVLNALTDDAHPMQVLADLHTTREARGRLEGLRICWVGDASNVARSWIEAAGLLKLDITLATPPAFAPPLPEVEEARARGGRITVTSDAREAAKDADVLLTDVWVSMGQEDEREYRIGALSPYRITQELVSLASPEVVVLHCLPAHRGEEIDADVLEGPRSFVWDAVESRLHTSKALLEWAALGPGFGPPPYAVGRGGAAG
ncbi:ornithine carbamoyltransferase [Polyangium jinanense]|uniref:ornithine carbamoyltransferase n=1 Tax=Polyangium jinanense TaxID=2829994 RepID=UPI0023403DEE|nr:ornithine carbamoyltransferase [Polyangium jinanense]MDC3953577.1 ornithine carbamoyltransferase [Polyangium jinanense]